MEMLRNVTLRNRRATHRWLVLGLLAVSLTLSACGPRELSPTAANVDGMQLVVELPAIILDVAEDGQITLGEGPLQQTVAALGVDLSALSMSAETVQDFVGAKIQHIQLDNRPDGLGIYVNGQPMPTLAWDETSLDSLVNVLGMVGTDLGPAAGLLPILPDLGIGLIVRFPSSGSAIPLARMVAPTGNNQNTLEAALAAQPAVDLSLNYGADGSYQLQGLNPFMLGMLPPDALQQSPDTLDSVSEMGINGLSLTMRPTGVLIQINGEPLPYIRSTDQEQLLRMIELVLQLQAPDAAAQYGGLIRQLLPALWAQGMRLSVNFPA
jgi:hypothetical protein